MQLKYTPYLQHNSMLYNALHQDNLEMIPLGGVLMLLLLYGDRLVWILYLSLLLLYLGIARYNIESSVVFLKNFCYETQVDHQPTPSHIIDYCNGIIDSLSVKVLVDFGCGDGSTLKRLHGRHRIGIEYNTAIFNQAQSNTAGHSCIELHNCNILDYTIPNNCVLYMYEPLWNVSHDTAMIVYDTLLKNINNTNTTCTVLYVTGVHTKHLDAGFFKQ